MSFYSIKRASICVVKRSDFQGEFGGIPRKVVKKSENAVRIKDDEPSCRKYQLNRVKVCDKIFAIAALNQARKFLAFYTISFPPCCSDDMAFAAFNVWQTRCRQEYGRFPFIWVAERQKIGTIHFHLLTTLRMDISLVNGFMRTTLLNYIDPNEYSREKLERYNGIDVDNVNYSKRSKNRKPHMKRKVDQVYKYIASYLSKYVSKGKEKFNHLPWHCSRDVSRLATSRRFCYDETNDIIDWWRREREQLKSCETEFFAVYFFPGWQNFTRYLGIDDYNQCVFDNYRREAV